MNTSANGFRRGMEDAHAEAAGALCLDDGSGCCAACGVALVPCDRCAGVGYHRAGCAAADDGTPEEGDRAQPEATEGASLESSLVGLALARLPLSPLLQTGVGGEARKGLQQTRGGAS